MPSNYHDEPPMSGCGCLVAIGVIVLGFLVCVAMVAGMMYQLFKLLGVHT